MNYTEEDLLNYVPNALVAYYNLAKDKINKQVLEAFLYKDSDGKPVENLVKNCLYFLEQQAVKEIIPLAYRVEMKIELRKALKDFGKNKRDIDFDIIGLFNKYQDQLSLGESIQVNVEPLVDTELKVINSDADYNMTSINPMAGSPSNDLRPLPNFRKLGIDRPIGPVTDEELSYFKGQTKLDGSPVSNQDFLSVGILLGNNDLIDDRYLQISALELGRLSEILKLRAKGSDEDHYFQVEGCHFRLINPKLGQDDSLQMHMNSALLGKEPYTALIARAIFPVPEKDAKQLEVIERVRRELYRDVSMTPIFDCLTCGSCGEMPINEIQKMGNKIVAIRLSLNENLTSDYCHNFEYCSMVIRTPRSDVIGGYLYSEVSVQGSSDGILSIDPIEDPGFVTGSVAMIKMNPILFSFGKRSNMPHYCSIHGIQGFSYSENKRVVGMATNVTGFANVAQVSAGAINDARLVVDPDSKL